MTTVYLLYVYFFLSYQRRFFSALYLSLVDVPCALNASIFLPLPWMILSVGGRSQWFYHLRKKDQRCRTSIQHEYECFHGILERGGDRTANFKTEGRKKEIRL